MFWTVSTSFHAMPAEYLAFRKIHKTPSPGCIGSWSRDSWSFATASIIPIHRVTNPSRITRRPTTSSIHQRLKFHWPSMKVQEWWRHVKGAKLSGDLGRKKTPSIRFQFWFQRCHNSSSCSQKEKVCARFSSTFFWGCGPFTNILRQLSESGSRTWHEVNPYGGLCEMYWNAVNENAVNEVTNHHMFQDFFPRDHSDHRLAMLSHHFLNFCTWLHFWKTLREFAGISDWRVHNLECQQLSYKQPSG